MNKVECQSRDSKSEEYSRAGEVTQQWSQTGPIKAIGLFLLPPFIAKGTCEKDICQLYQYQLVRVTTSYVKEVKAMSAFLFCPT